MVGLGEWDRSAGYKMKNDSMVGVDDGSKNLLWCLTKTHEYELAKSPQQWSSGLV